MASYYPPTENLPIFDSEVFEQGQIEGEKASGGGGGGGSYLDYPIAQGAETLFAGSSVNGGFTVVGDLTLDSSTIITGNTSDGILIGQSTTVPLATGSIVVNNNTLTTAGITGTNNIIIGEGAGTQMTSGYGNNAIGASSLNVCTSGYRNIANGGASLTGCTTGYQNVAMGTSSGATISTGNSNTFIGFAADSNMNNAVKNTSIGSGAKANGATYSTAIGADSVSTASNQIMIGRASDKMTIPQTNGIVNYSAPNNNIINGTASSGGSITTATNNIGMGINVFNGLTTGTNNNVFGSSSLTGVTSGYGNNAFGQNSLTICSTGFRNMAMGGSSLPALTSGSHNVAIGYQSGFRATTATSSIMIGQNAGQNLTTGNNNTFIGDTTGQNTTTEDYNTCIGYSADVNAGVSNSTAIGRGATATASNQIVLGRVADTVKIPNRIQMANNTYLYSGNNFNSISFAVNNTTYATDLTILDTQLMLTATAGSLTFTIPTPVGNANRTLYIANEGGNVFTLLNNNSSNWLGDYGSGTSSLVIPDNTNQYLYSDGTNWQVYQRTGNFNLDIPLSANADYSTNYQIMDSQIRIPATGTTGAYTLTLPLASNTGSHNCAMTILNNSLFIQTISTASGTFVGKFGNGQSTLQLYPWTQVQIYSNGVNWQANSMGTTTPNIYISLTASTNYSAYTLYSNSYLYITPNANNYDFTFPQPNNANGAYGRCRVSNLSTSYFFNLKLGTGSFTGAYGSAGNTIIIPSNSWIDMTSDGTNWVCNDVSAFGWQYPAYQISTGPTFINSTQTQWFRTFLAGAPTSPNNTNFGCGATYPPAYMSGLRVTLKRQGGAVGGGFYISGTATAPIYINNSNQPFYGSQGIATSAEDLQVIKVGAIGNGGGATVRTSTNCNAVVISNYATSLVSGQLAVGQTILVDGTNTYTINALYSGVGGASLTGTITGTAGSSSVTINTYNGYFFNAVGQTITVASIAYTFTITADGQTGAGTISPVVPVGGWSGATFTTSYPFSNTTIIAGITTAGAANASGKSLAYTSDVFAWGTCNN